MFSEKTISKDEECDVEIQCRCVEMYTNKNSSDIKALGEQVVFSFLSPHFSVMTFYRLEYAVQKGKAVSSLVYMESST